MLICIKIVYSFICFVVQFLADKEPGESIVRPSSLGPSHLTLTLKIYDAVYAHKDIAEGGKENNDITSLLRIGRTLKIGDETYEDLDEVTLKYVNLEIFEFFYGFSSRMMHVWWIT